MKELLLSLLFVSSLSADPIPADARKLLEIRQQAVHKIDLAYAKQLDALMAKYAAAGDTANAAVIAGMIAEVESPADTAPIQATATAPEKMAAMEGTWRRDYDGSMWVFTSSGTGNFNGKEPFTMTYDPGQKRITVLSAKWTNLLAFTPDPDVLNGTYQIGGKKHRYKLTRVK